jgi:ABC transporter substrate binding protein
VTEILGVLGPKRLELLRELVPTATTIAILINPNSPITNKHLALEQAAARSLGQQVIVASAGTKNDLDAAFAMIVQQAANALIVNDDPFFISSRERLVALAARHALPTIYFQRSFAASGGLISYGPSPSSRRARLASTSAASSKVKGPPICRSNSRPSSSWSLISRLLRRSDFLYRPRCSLMLTR